MNVVVDSQLHDWRNDVMSTSQPILLARLFRDNAVRCRRLASGRKSVLEIEQLTALATKYDHEASMLEGSVRCIPARPTGQKLRKARERGLRRRGRYGKGGVDAAKAQGS